MKLEDLVAILKQLEDATVNTVSAKDGGEQYKLFTTAKDALKKVALIKLEKL